MRDDLARYKLRLIGVESVNVQSLKTVGQVLGLYGSHDCGMHTGVGFPYVEIDLPSLRTTNHCS